MIEIYTDASVANGKAVATCFVITDSNFIGCKTSEFDSVETSLEGELEGAIAALEYVQDVIPMDACTLYCDSISLIRLIQTNLSTSKNRKAIEHKQRLQRLQDLVKQNNIKLDLIKGHSTGHNPNKVVDLISNSVLKYVGKE